MSNPVRAIPEGYHSVTPYLTVRAQPKAIDFYRSVFGAKEIMRWPALTAKSATPKYKSATPGLCWPTSPRHVQPRPRRSQEPVRSFPCTWKTWTLPLTAPSLRRQSRHATRQSVLGDRYGKLTDPFGISGASPQHMETSRRKKCRRRSQEFAAKMAKAAAAEEVISAHQDLRGPRRLGSNRRGLSFHEFF